MKPLRGIKVVSLALNLPGPAALVRLHALGARCVKLEPPLRAGVSDPMQVYAPAAYEELHRGIRVIHADLKSPQGQERLRRELSNADVLLTSFRPSALRRLDLGWRGLQREHPRLSLVRIVGRPGREAEVPGHDLTYMAEHDLVQGLHLPATLFADMAGALMACEAVLQALLRRQSTGKGCEQEVSLSHAAAWLARPRLWGLTQAQGVVGGSHAGYRVYACRDGRVAVAALEPHFAERLCAVAGIPGSHMRQPATRDALTAWFASQSRRQLERLAAEHDLPLHSLPR